MKDSQPEIVIAELNSKAIFAHILAAVVLISFTLQQMISGENFEGGIFEPLFGPFLAPLMLLGLGYALYEFLTTYRKRSRYITIRENRVTVIAQGTISLSSPSKVQIERGMVDNLVLEGSAGGRMKVRSYMIKGGAEQARLALVNYLEGRLTTRN